MFTRLLVVGVVLAIGPGIATAQNPVSPADFLIKEGKRLRNAKELDAALEYFEAAAKVDPKNANAFVQAAWVANEQGDFGKGATLATTATKLAPNNSDAWSELGYAQMKQKQYIQAVRSLQTAIEKDETNWSAYDYLADAYRAGGDQNGAKAVEAQKKKKMDTVKDKPKGKD